MRDINRIKSIQEKLTTLWMKDPDQRFMQFIYNIQYLYSSHNGNYGKIFNGEAYGYDMFYLEDDKFEKFLDELLEG